MPFPPDVLLSVEHNARIHDLARQALPYGEQRVRNLIAAGEWDKAYAASRDHAGTFARMIANAAHRHGTTVDQEAARLGYDQANRAAASTKRAA